MPFWKRAASSCSLALVSIAPAVAQDQNSRRAEQAKPGDIVITGERLPEPTFTVRHPMTPAIGTILTINERSERFARCAKKIDLTLLRRIVDGPVHTPRMDYSVDRAIRTNIGCYSDSYMPSQPEPWYGQCNAITVSGMIGVCRSIYDRAAIVAEAVYRYAADIELVPEHMINPIIRKRLQELELLRYRHADVRAKQAAQLALCVVAHQPARATRLVRMHGNPNRQTRLAAEMLAYSSACTGETKSFTVEPLMLRAGLVDAFYRWAVAAKGVPSLLPPGPA